MTQFFCHGTCQSWLHRGCAGLSYKAIEAQVNSKGEFYCPTCHLNVLEGIVADMKRELTIVKHALPLSPRILISMESLAGGAFSFKLCLEAMPPLQLMGLHPFHQGHWILLVSRILLKPVRMHVEGRKV